MTGQTVWLASYPKSGNTWFRAVYTAWRADGPIDLAELQGGPIASSRELFDQALGIPSSSLTPDEVELLRPRADELIAAGDSEPRLRKIHDAYFRGPGGESIVSVGATRSALYVVRDPRDVAVSLAHHSGKTPEWAAGHLANPDAGVGGGRDGLARQLRQRLGTWSDHVRSWVDETPFPVEVVRYEDCIAAPVATFARALRWAGFAPVDEARLAGAVDSVTFERLRDAEQEQGFRERPSEAGAFFRRGESGAWREELPAELAARIEDEHGEVMARLGYEASAS